MLKLISLSIALSLGAITTAQTIYGRISEVLIANGFSLRHLGDHTDLPLGLDCTFYDSAHRVSIRVTGGQINDVATKAAAPKGVRFAAEPAPNSALANGSLGENCHYLGNIKYACSISSIVDRYGLDILVSWNPPGIDSEIAERAQYGRALCERLARRILGEAMALDLNDDATVRTTSNLTGLETDKTGFVTLATWAKAHSVDVTYDDTTEVASFTYHNKLVKLPLASGKVIVNGQELALGGKFIMARAKLWFVPRAELDSAVG